MTYRVPPFPSARTFRDFARRHFWPSASRARFTCFQLYPVSLMIRAIVHVPCHTSIPSVLLRDLMAFQLLPGSSCSRRSLVAPPA
jgi:hypothetical protein